MMPESTPDPAGRSAAAGAERTGQSWETSARMTTVVYTDGACSGNPGPGGWAWAVPGGAFASGPDPDTTNQRMEITAALAAVRANPGGLEVVSDSTYVVNCFRDRWWEGWLRKGWVNSQRKPVANRDLWEPLIILVRDRGDVVFRWVMGHGGDPMNDLVDRLAVEAALTQRPRAGDQPPAEVGPADTSTARAAAVGAVPLPGRPVLVLGHRPPELGGYRAFEGRGSDAVRDLRRRLTEIIEAKHQLHDDLVVVTGLRLGAETLGAEAALAAGVPHIVVLPYPGPDAMWPAPARRHFRELVDAAVDVITLQRKAPASKQRAGAALARRDAWFARHVAEAILVWDGIDDALGRVHRALVDHLGEGEVWIVEP
jgi:ribonuclease HI